MPSPVEKARNVMDAISKENVAPSNPILLMVSRVCCHARVGCVCSCSTKMVD